LSDDGLSVAASDGHATASMCVFVRYQGIAE
jgi:hypothetical protein